MVALTSVVSIGRQVERFGELAPRLREAVGGERADGVVKGAVIVISTGPNATMIELLFDSCDII